jgi:hypothetical protein
MIYVFIVLVQKTEGKKPPMRRSVSLRVQKNLFCLADFLFCLIENRTDIAMCSFSSAEEVKKMSARNCENNFTPLKNLGLGVYLRK